jgi:hypothetical protein
VLAQQRGDAAKGTRTLAVLVATVGGAAIALPDHSEVVLKPVKALHQLRGVADRHARGRQRRRRLSDEPLQPPLLLALHPPLPPRVARRVLAQAAGIRARHGTRSRSRRAAGPFFLEPYERARAAEQLGLQAE